MDFLRTVTLLAEGEPATAPGLSGMLVPMVLIVFVWYFLILRPQGRERKHRDQLLANLKRNDRVVTYSGIIGTITGFSDDNKEVTLRVDDNVKLRFLRSAIQGPLAEVSATPEAPKAGAT
jgi:preprotein translocase subunit YajC